MSENFSPNSGSADAPKFTPAPPPQGAPVPPPMQGYQPKPSAALAITALVLGIFAFFTGLLFIGGALGLVSVILGIISLKKVKAGTASGKGMAITGIILGALGIIATIGMIIFFTWAAAEAQNCVNTGVRNSDGSVTCTINGKTTTIH